MSFIGSAVFFRFLTVESTRSPVITTMSTRKQLILKLIQLYMDSYKEYIVQRYLFNKRSLRNRCFVTLQYFKLCQIIHLTIKMILKSNLYSHCSHSHFFQWDTFCILHTNILILFLSLYLKSDTL